MTQRARAHAILAAAVTLAALAATAAAQHTHTHGDAAKKADPKKAEPPAASRRVTMDELHRGGGVPPGWKFTLPAGDPARGKKVFAELECYKCHRVDGAGFPPLGSDGKTGPNLTGMGRHHPAEYFAESILAPNAVLLEGPGWIGRDGKSIMPSYADSLSVTQLLDLVAFIRSQDGGAHGAHGQQGGHGQHAPAPAPRRTR
ncbi:MAG TPA: c-type cytochrome [Terriglobales bacterium]|nr:c-type cytochrome [Terriglobales bacterium]